MKMINRHTNWKKVGTSIDRDAGNTFEVKYIGETAILFEPVGVLLTNSEQQEKNINHMP
jgi:hypothetical protein